MKGHRLYQPVGFTLSRDIPDESDEQIAPVDATDAPLRHEERVVWDEPEETFRP